MALLVFTTDATDFFLSILRLLFFDSVVEYGTTNHCFKLVLKTPQEGLQFVSFGL